MKKVVKVELESLYLDFFETDLGELIRKIQELKSQLEAKGLFNVHLKANTGYDHSDFGVCADRMETDAEEQKRECREQKARERAREDAKIRKQKRLDTERKEWERLNKKFGSKS